MATVSFQVTENCENRENAITHCFFMDLLQILHSGAKYLHKHNIHLNIAKQTPQRT